MDIFHGKKALCFIALPHHNRFILPVMQALSRRGMEIVFITAAAEAAFEITLNKAGLPYRHALDYATPEIKEKVAAAWRQLRPVWQEKVLTQPVMQAIALPIQDKVIHSAIENFFCFQRLLEVEKPDLVFALHELTSWGKILGYLSHVFRIPYITFQEGLCYSRIPFHRFHTDYSTACVLWGEADRQVLLAAGCSADKTVALGNIDIWAARQRNTRSEAVAATRTALSVGSDKKIVLFLMSHASYKPLPVTVFRDWLKARRDVVVIFKWHPITGKDIIERALAPLAGMPNILSLEDFDTYALLGASDLCVLVGNSTTGIEALVYGKPLIEIALPDHDYSFAAQGVAEPAEDFADAREKIETILAQGLRPERQEQVRLWIAHHFAFQDDKTAERVADMAEVMLTARAKKCHPLPVVEADRFFCSLILPVDDTPLESVLATLQGIAAHIPADLFEIVIVNAAMQPETHALLTSLEGDVRLIAAEPGTSFATCCNRAAAQAQGKYLVFLKPGLIPCPGWLEGLLEVAEGEEGIGIVGGRVCHENGLLWQVGVAFDINQSPFSLYRLLPPEFSGAQRQREFQAVEAPFLVSREQFCRMGGFSPDLLNRFEDIDFCLRMRAAGLRVLYTPRGTILQAAASWQPTPQQDQTTRFRFYARWTGSLWQDDDCYLAEDGLDRDGLSALYREMAARVAAGARETVAQLPA